jgi:hypothetical protein
MRRRANWKPSAANAARLWESVRSSPPNQATQGRLCLPRQARAFSPLGEFLQYIFGRWRTDEFQHLDAAQTAQRVRHALRFGSKLQEDFFNALPHLQGRFFSQAPQQCRFRQHPESCQLLARPFAHGKVLAFQVAEQTSTPSDRAIPFPPRSTLCSCDSGVPGQLNANEPTGHTAVAEAFAPFGLK